MNLQMLTPSLLGALGGVFVILIVASLSVVLLRRAHPDKDYTELRLRIKSWWVMAGIFSVAIALHKTLTLTFLGLVSFLALKEFLSLIPTRRADRRVLFWAYLAIPIQFYWIGIGWYDMFIIFIPVFVFLFLPLRMVLIGETEGFLRAASTLHWGMMVTVFGLSHAAYLIALPDEGNPAGAGAGLLLYLVFLTQFNDVAQYLWGKTLGRRKVVPSVSPNKTWGGLLGGLITTTVLATLLAPWLTPLSTPHALAAGLLIGLGGFIGDINISAVKRDLQVKDSGALLPGHGGILDRVDSLSYTAPLFFHFIHYLYY